MRCQVCAAGVLFALGSSVLVFAQSSDPAAANRELINGASVDIQTSANATLDVGGAGAANPKVTGGNLRGNLGASLPQPVTGTSPPSPNAGLPTYSFETPNFGPAVRGLFPDRKPTKEELRAVQELILPRFRAPLENSKAAVSPARQSDGWRYQYFNGRWWYWRPNETWAYWNGSQWRQRSVNQ